MDRTDREYHLLKRQQNERVLRIIAPLLVVVQPLLGAVDVVVMSREADAGSPLTYGIAHVLVWLAALFVFLSSRWMRPFFRKRATLLMALVGPILIAGQVVGLLISGRPLLQLVLVTVLATSFMAQLRPSSGLIHLGIGTALVLPVVVLNDVPMLVAVPELIAVVTLGVILVYIRDGFVRQTLDLAAKTRLLRKEIPILRRFEENLKRSEDRLAEAQSVAHVGSWEWDFKNQEIYCSEELYRILGLDVKPNHVNTLFGALFERVHPEDQAEVKKRIATAFEAQEPYRVEHRLVLPDKSVRYLMGQGLIHWDSTNKPDRLIGTVFDITSRKQAEDEVKRLAFQDGLTGLANRVLLTERLELELAHARRQGTTLAVMFLDLDRFKVINDSLGHSVGDWLLCQVSDRIRDVLRSSDTVARQGGDEFIVVLPDVKNAGNVKSVASKLLNAIGHMYEYEEHELYISSSIGIALFPVNGQTSDELLKNADAAMYYAKSKGKASFQFYMDNLDDKAQRMFELEGKLRKAVEARDFLLHYQPRVSLDTGEMTGLEALIRWQYGDQLISPAEFIPLAEETGLIIPMGDWVVKEACTQHLRHLQRQRADQMPVMIAVNCSPRQFQQPDLDLRIQEILAETGLSPGLLEIEITEGTVMQDPDRAQQTMKKLKELGVQISIDDFGTGYSSLSYLRRFPIDRLKIDRSFINEVPGEAEDEAIVDSILSLARSLRMTVIAEGVETEAQVDFLKDRECDEIQGFHYCRPLPADRMEQFLVDWHLLGERRSIEGG